MVQILTVLSIHWCTCEINSYKIMFIAPYSMTKLFEFQEGYIENERSIRIGQTRTINQNQSNIGVKNQNREIILSA